MIRVLGAAVISLVTVGVAASTVDEEKFGKGVSLTEATPIEALYETPGAFVGKTIRIDGVVTAVCEDMGCWMALAASDESENTVRLKVDDGAGIVFPISAKGKHASAEGVFEKIADTDVEAMEAAAEQATKMNVSDFAKKYQIKTTGAIVR